MKYTMDQFLQICSPLSTDLNIDLTLGPKDAYDILSLSRLCANRVTVHLDWAVLGGRLHLQLIRETAGKTFSETTKLLKIYLNADYYKFVMENAQVLDTILNESNSDKRSAIAIGVLEKSYLLQYNKCGNCKQDCPECETFYTGETPEQLYMRVATFLCMPDLKMIKTAYNYLSENYYSHATPTMFNAGTLRCQMASCFVLTVDDSLWSIEDHWTYTGEISRNSGGIGLDVSKIRHSQIGNSGKSDGVPGLLKPFESILVYVDQSKKRKGSAAAYLSVWHVDIEDFIEMKVPVGQGKESKTKCEDLFYGAWVPDLFVQRCKQDADWTLFCPKRCPGLTEVYGKNFEDLYLRYEREGKGIKTVKAKSIVQLLFSAQTKVGVPYISFSDRFNDSSMQRNIGPIRSSNLCVAPSTYILTDKGQIKIGELENKNVNVWNGQEFTNTTVVKTGENQKMYKVKFSNGSTLKCTPYHKFYIQIKVPRHKPYDKHPSYVQAIEAKDLKPGMKLIKTDFPVIHDGVHFPYAYTHGAFCGDGTYEHRRTDDKYCEKDAMSGAAYCKRHMPHQALLKEPTTSDVCLAKLGNIPRLSLYGEKKLLVEYLDTRSISKEDAEGRINCKLPLDLQEKFTVPINACMKDKLQWFAGYCDMDGTICRNGTNQSLQVCCIDNKFLEKVKLMLQTMGCDPKVTKNVDAGMRLMPDHQDGEKEYMCQTSYRLLVNSNDLYHLVELGFAPKRLQIVHRKPQRNAKQFITVVSTKELNNLSDTYCFKEEKRGMGIFNGVITGQCNEISLHTSEKEIASCNLASLCLSKFVKTENGEKKFDFDMLAQVTRFVVRIMNNVIDRNYYPERIPQIKYANLKNRPLGIGIQGLANTYAKLELLFDSLEARVLNDQIIQTIYYYAVDESANLAAESGAYEAFPGSPYSEGLLHPDIWRAPNGDRANFWDKLDWSRLRNKVSKGVKNSTLLALMPTATSSIIAEQEPCFEPFNFIVGSKTLISGQYTVVCREFAEDLQKLGVWTPELAKEISQDEENELGNLTTVKMPESIKGNKLKEARWQFILDKYRTAYEIGARESIKQAIARTPFVCQSQSLNWFVPEPSWNKFYNNFIQSWERGLKTGCYYNRGKSGMKARSVVSRCESCTG